MTEVYVNSKFVGNVDDAASFVNSVREARRTGNMTPNLNIYHHEKADEIFRTCFYRCFKYERGIQPLSTR